MAATVNTREFNGSAPGTPTTIGTLYLQTIDQSGESGSALLMKPTAGNYYSYWKTVYLNCETSPVTQINNIKLFSDGTIAWTDIVLYVGDETPVLGSYAQATGTQGLTGVEMVANHAAISGRTDMTTYVTGSPKDISGSISNPDTGQISNLVVLQAELGTSAVAGPLSGEVLTWRYDET